MMSWAHKKKLFFNYREEVFQVNNKVHNENQYFKFTIGIDVSSSNAYTAYAKVNEEI